VPALCDVNVLLALVTDHHTLHGLAVRWADTVPADGAVLCRVAQMGLLRLLNNPRGDGRKCVGCRRLLVALAPFARRRAISI
jgi:predicted nucleic acid-binding protein